MSASGPVGGPSPIPDPSIAESVQRAQAIAASLARSKGVLPTPQGPSGTPPAPPPIPHSGFSQGPPSASRGPHASPRVPSSFDHGGSHDSGFSHGPPSASRGPHGGPPAFDHAGMHGTADKQPPHILPVPGRNEGGPWNSVDAAAAIAAQQKQMLQQRARKAALRAMATVCAAIPKPDIKEEDLLGDLKKTARQKENGVWILDIPLQTGVCGVTAAAPDAWQQLQQQEVIASLRRRTGAGFVLRGRPLQQQQQQEQQQQQAAQGVYVRVVGDDQETVYRGTVAAWSVLGARQYLPAPMDAGEDETFDCAAAMAGEDDEFLKDVCHRTGALVDIEQDHPQGYNHTGDRPGLRYSVTACTQAAMERALRLLRWRLVCIEEAWRQHNAHGFTRDSSPTPHRGGWRETPYGATPQDMRGVAAASFWQSAMPDEAEMTRRRREAEERRKKRGQRSRSASPDRRAPNKLSFAPPPDELLTGPYAPLDK